MFFSPANFVRGQNMLSRLALKSGHFGFAVRGQLNRCAAPALVRGASSEVSKQDPFDKAYTLYNSPDRDLVNFPNPKMPDVSPPVRLGFLPEHWFQAFYDKTGVTGPYLFGTGLIATLLSKEIWVVDHGFTEVLGFWAAMFILIKKIGPAFGEYLDKRSESYKEVFYDKPLQNAKSASLEFIDNTEKMIEAQKGQKFLFEAKRENVGLQLEAIYRQRLHDAHQEVKKRLDYQVDVQNTKRSFEQTHMVNWIVDNVIKGIDAKQEKDALSKCIADLKVLSKTHAASL
ncbi:ATP synthase subunit b, mitochondrial-like [Lineus longissimus]|uniref:ATP synthase subunit b, mitochondrial-like n=1 Tax=Lineus longissimus TaxID=88925 RepID=UPI00315C9333